MKKASTGHFLSHAIEMNPAISGTRKDVTAPGWKIRFSIKKVELVRERFTIPH